MALIWALRQNVAQSCFHISSLDPCDADLKEESGGSLFMTVSRRVRRPFFPSHTRLLSVFTRASTSGMLAFREMALSSFSS